MVAPVRVVLVGGHPVILGVARLACEVEGRIEIVGEAGTDDDALHAIAATQPDVLVLDLELPGADGLAVLRTAREAGFAGKVVVISDRADGHVVLDATRLDATGFLSKPGGLREIGRAVIEVAAGGRVVDPSLDQAAVYEVGRLARQVREGAEVGALLTHRERQILTFLAEGMTTQQIARRLRISPRTVEAPRREAVSQARRPDPGAGRLEGGLARSVGHGLRGSQGLPRPRRYVRQWARASRGPLVTAILLRSSVMTRRNPPIDPPTAPARRRLGVVVIDPLSVVRAGLGRLIADRADMEVLAEPRDADEGLAALERLRRTRVVVLVGLGLEGERDAAWMIRTIRERFPSHAVLAVGANAEPVAISQRCSWGPTASWTRTSIPRSSWTRSAGPPNARWCSPDRRRPRSVSSRSDSSTGAIWTSSSPSGSDRSSRSPPRA